MARGNANHDGRVDLSDAVFVRYKVLKLWEQPPQPILAMESPGLCPFLPLMAGKAEELLVQSVEKIRKAPESVASAEAKRELLTVLGALASKVIKEKDFLRRLLSELRLMGENWFLDEVRKEGEAVGLATGREQGRKEGRKEGARQASLEALWTVLTARFGELPADLRARIDTEPTVEGIRRFLRLAAASPDLEAFRSGMRNG